MLKIRDTLAFRRGAANTEVTCDQTLGDSETSSTGIVCVTGSKIIEKKILTKRWMVNLTFTNRPTMISIIKRLNFITFLANPKQKYVTSQIKKKKSI